MVADQKLCERLLCVCGVRKRPCAIVMDVECRGETEQEINDCVVQVSERPNGQ